MEIQSALLNDTLTLYDSIRLRKIPIQILSNTVCNGKVVIFNHGYGENKGGDYLKYSHITRYLAFKGYYVISIQHELQNDSLLAMEGNLYKNRMSNWEKGVQNILFVINKMKEKKPHLNWNNVSLVGHSNGGDMIMLFVRKYPSLITHAISLDNRRMPIPRTTKVKVCSLRGCDYQADKGVIPSLDEQKKYKIKIVNLKNIGHSDMDDDASPKQSAVINKHILDFLED